MQWQSTSLMRVQGVSDGQFRKKEIAASHHYMYVVLYVHLEQQHGILFHLPNFFLYLKICSEAQSGF